MIALNKITTFLDDLIDTNSIPTDISNNGLQVEASATVNKVVFGVDASLALFEEAAKQQADLVFVHHGISWGAEPRRFTGVTGKRLQCLFSNSISLYATHLPLDAHPVLGHNALIASQLDLDHKHSFGNYHGVKIGMVGGYETPQTIDTICAKLQNYLPLDDAPQIFSANPKPVNNIGIIAGSGGLDALLEAQQAGIECFITGEINHTMYNFIQESGVTVITLGHYKSEEPGVKAVMKAVQDSSLDVTCSYVDVPTGL